MVQADKEAIFFEFYYCTDWFPVLFPPFISGHSFSDGFLWFPPICSRPIKARWKTWPQPRCVNYNSFECCSLSWWINWSEEVVLTRAWSGQTPSKFVAFDSFALWRVELFRRGQDMETRGVRTLSCTLADGSSCKLRSHCALCSVLMRHPRICIATIISVVFIIITCITDVHR